MAQNSTIEWTESTWNPTSGCTKISQGCARCYAERIAERFRGVEGHPFEQGFDLKLWPHRLKLPFEWKRPRFIFVNSMSDLFHEKVPDAFIDQVFEVMETVNRHIYQVLTKRSDRMQKYLSRRYCERDLAKHIWMGVSAEDKKTVPRISHLQSAPAGIRFLSLEPLLESLGSLDLTNIHWVIAGGESGPRHRPVRLEWLREIRDECVRQKVPFFFKQWGGARPKSHGNLLDGETWQQYPRIDGLTLLS